MEYNGHASTAPKPKPKRKNLLTISRPSVTCEVYERDGKPYFQLQSRLKIATEYPAAALEDLLFISHELTDFVIEWDKTHRKAVQDAT